MRLILAVKTGLEPHVERGPSLLFRDWRNSHISAEPLGQTWLRVCWAFVVGLFEVKFLKTVNPEILGSPPLGATSLDTGTTVEGMETETGLGLMTQCLAISLNCVMHSYIDSISSPSNENLLLT